MPPKWANRLALISGTYYTTYLFNLSFWKWSQISRGRNNLEKTLGLVYKSRVHDNASLSKIDKFNYLKSLQDVAASRAIQALTLICYDLIAIHQ